MTRPPFTIRALGEIAIRCDNVARMAEFYGGVLGLDPMPGSAAPGIAFFRIAEGFGGHTQILALFDKALSPRPGLHPVGQDAPETGARSSLHHLALSLPFAEQDAAIAWLETRGLPVRVEHFAWVGWRGVFTEDPEGNTVELVAHDPGPKD